MGDFYWGYFEGIFGWGLLEGLLRKVEGLGRGGLGDFRER